MMIEGGYLTLRTPLIRSGIHRHTAGIERIEVGPAHLGALNAIQATPWRINRFILDVVEEAWSSGLSLPGLPCAEDEPLPARLPDDVWQGMSRRERARYKSSIAAIHARNASLAQQRGDFLAALCVAQEFADEDAIWLPHSLDFRGRIYPIPALGPNPQGCDLQRALLHFAEGRPLGPTGTYWLAVRAGGAWGHGVDKMDPEGRVAWLEGRLDRVAAWAERPLEDLGWTEAEEPWQFLATCREIYMALQVPDGPEGFISHLPVNVDGTCNGLQHLSAIALDPVGGEATNLTPGPRRDIYATVAEAVEALVQADREAGHEIALRIPTVTRKIVKRAVMTTPYGVTAFGIGAQLISDGHLDFLERENQSAAAAYLREKIIQGLQGVVGAATTLMSWIQNVARTLAEAGIPLEWTTPLGTRLRQSYWRLRIRRVKTLQGTLLLWEEDLRAGLDPRKNALASAPNWIHSIDAAHLALTIEAMVLRGVRSFASIHDSVGVHACHVSELNTELRRTFRRLHREDLARRLYDEVRAAHPQVTVPEPPPRGTLDLALIEESRFFFA